MPRLLHIASYALVVMSSITGQAQLKISHAEYHGWKDALILNNGIAEIAVVPEIGRVMQFHFMCEDPVFWENRALDGMGATKNEKDWTNFGGDKSWPSPQAEWEKMIGRGWPPPFTFDQVQMKPEVENGIVILETLVDPQYGIRERREVRLDGSKPVMQITTTYEKLSRHPC